MQQTHLKIDTLTRHKIKNRTTAFLLRNAKASF